ncbi:acyl-CoA-binding domain-containing protein 3-like [Vigna unguiculata]|uniref:acyl-CoA-binding domain-containing protein 3-like n=1 Tax=Vigna unguiculata TaxID=3917 RepID=UPI0010165784|nr:acyl-CoA-binding domain-containing protein 3-like [Vigna unguiculata]
MELLTVVDDFFVTASLALLLTFIVLKLVEVVNDIHATPKRHLAPQPIPPLSHAERFMVQRAQSESKLRFSTPVHYVTEYKIEKPTLEPVPQSKAVEIECEEATVEPVPPVQPAESKDTICCISPVQAATCVGSEHKVEEAVVELDSNFVLESPVKSHTDIVVIEEIAETNEGTTQEFEEKRDVESVEDPCTEIEVSAVENGVKENDYNDDDDDDDWEGIERSELEKEFMAATEFVANEGDRLENVGSNVKMELYGLHKVATEGPCREPQPMALKLSARAKWNAWQKLGSMNPEVAMEQYISLLSNKFPEWMKDTSTGISGHEPIKPEVSESAASDLSTTLSHQQLILANRELEQESYSEERSPLAGSDLNNNVNK